MVEKDPVLEFEYMKKAAELGKITFLLTLVNAEYNNLWTGLVEAQHNLGVMYLEGKIVKYNGLKAMAWFSHAGAAGFAHSQVST